MQPEHTPESIDTLFQQVREMTLELSRWRLLGPFEKVAKNVCYLAYVLKEMSKDPHLLILLTQYMTEFQEIEQRASTSTPDKMKWLETELEGMNLDGTSSGEDTAT